MSFVTNLLSKVTNFSVAPLYRIASNNVTSATANLKTNFFTSWFTWQSIPIRTRYVDWRMLRDVKRRRMVKEYATARLRVNAIRRNTIVPKEIQACTGIKDTYAALQEMQNGKEIADREINAFPRDSNKTRITDRCMLTSRPRGVIRTHRVSRIMWRLLADYNKMSGVIRAKW